MASTYFTDIQKLYVTYFARPADPAGLQYWENVVEGAHGSLAAVSVAFAQSAEYKQVTFSLTAYQAINILYNNLFGHDADLAGLSFWAQGLQSGGFTMNQAAAAIVAGAQGTDLQAFNVKVTAAIEFTNALDTAQEVLAYQGDNGSFWGRYYLYQATIDNPHPPFDPPPKAFVGIDLVGVPATGPDPAGL